MSRIYNPSGGFRKLYSFQFATIVHLATMDFCKRYIPWQQDQLGKTVGQMVGASRSGKQNIIEGSERAKTSAETEIKLTDVAKASLSELQGDLEDYLVQKNSIPWSIHNPDHAAVMGVMLDAFEHTDDLLHDFWVHLLAQKRKFDPWLVDRDDITAANGLILLIQRATGLLGKQLKQLEEAFVTQGGVREKMHRARTEAKASAPPDPGAPHCPECGKPMRHRKSAKGPFWGCSAYPDCRATLPERAGEGKQGGGRRV